MKPTKPPTFTTDAMNALIGDGAPWYTSGAHEWNGTADTLKPKPTSISARPARSRPSFRSTASERNCWMCPRLVEPVAP